MCDSENLCLCKKELLLNRCFDKNDNSVEYRCNANNLGLKIDCRNISIDDMNNIDKKIYTAFIPYCWSCTQRYYQ